LTGIFSQIRSSPKLAFPSDLSHPSSAAEGSDFGANFTSFDSPGNFFEAEFQSAPSTSES
jgi:hypothetical protein